MFPRAFRIARISGIDVRVDPSWILIALLVVWTFFQRFTVTAERDVATGLAMGGAAAVLFFLSVLAHELGHALEARSRGVKVNGITLFLFGGVTEMHVEAKRPFDEFALAAVGPFVSLVTGAALGLVATGVETYLPNSAQPVAEVAGVLGWINVALAIFNLIPGAPLDGGRVLRSIVWAATKDRARSVRIAARSGQVVGGLLFGLAAFSILSQPEALFDGLWLAFIAWFLWQAAQAELRQADIDQLLKGRTVASLLTVTAPSLDAEQPLSLVVDQVALTPGFELFPVERDGELVGALSLQEIRDMHPTDRAFRLAGDVMRPVTDLPHVPADAGLRSLIGALEGEPAVVVTVAGSPRTLLTTGQVGAALERLRALERHRSGQAPPSVPSVSTLPPPPPNAPRAMLPPPDSDGRDA